MIDEEYIVIKLKKDDALVLFDLLNDEFFHILGESIVKDKNKLWPLIHILNDLETHITESFSNKYNELVQLSLDNIIKECGDLNQ